MSEIALYNALTKLGLDHDEAKEAVADVASNKDVATKADIAEVKAEIRAMKWMLGLLVAINIAFIVSAVSLPIRFV